MTLATTPHFFHPATSNHAFCSTCGEYERHQIHLTAESFRTPTEIIAAESDPNGIHQHTPGAKLDAGKLRPWLCIAGFANALRAVADVTTKGAAKYTPGGWQHVENGSERYMDAFGRHLLSLGSGEVIDPDTRCYHKAQMAWNLLASLELELRAERST